MSDRPTENLINLEVIAVDLQMGDGDPKAGAIELRKLWREQRGAPRITALRRTGPWFVNRDELAAYLRDRAWLTADEVDARCRSVRRAADPRGVRLLEGGAC